MKKQTKPTKKSNIERNWHLIDANNQILGRLSTNIAELLMGKSKPYFVRNLDCGDYVVVVNTKNIRVTGKKETEKEYLRYSGYPGGLKREALKDLRSRKPEEIIRHAVSGMLPKNKLHDRMLKRLFLFPESENPYKDRFKIQDSK